MGQLHGAGAGQQLVVCGPILDLLHILARLEHQTGAHKGHVQQHVDLVEGQPVLDQPAEVVEQHLAVAHKGVDHAAVFPAAVLLDQRNGGVKVADGDQRLDAVLAALLEHAAVEGDASRIGLGIVAVGEDAGPRNGQTIALEAHLRKQGNILFVVVVHVDGLVGGVEVLCIALQHLHLAARHRAAVGTEGDHIHAGQPTAVHIVCALTLVGSGCTAPQKAFLHFHTDILTFFLSWAVPIGIPAPLV